MSKFSNIYDIDGNIIHKAGDKPYTIEQVEQLVDDLTKKVEENPDNEAYKVYLNNAHKWLTNMYHHMSPADIMKRINLVKSQVDEAKSNLTEAEQSMLDEVNKSMEELKKQYDKDEIVMDEYVQFDELPVSDETLKEPIEEIKDGNVDA